MKTISILVIAAIILPFVACNNMNKTPMVNAGNDSLTKKITQLEDTLRKEKANKKLVADFYQQLFGDKDITAIDTYLSPDYIQHNPSVADGSAALKQAVTQWFKGAPKEKVNIQHIGADGNLVYIHTKSEMNGKAVSIVDIFRVENGKIMEHWDVIQNVPEKAANPHPMF